MFNLNDKNTSSLNFIKCQLFFTESNCQHETKIRLKNEGKKAEFLMIFLYSVLYVCLIFAFNVAKKVF
jgi:hypothetical protein